MFIKKSILLFVTAVTAVFFTYPQLVQAATVKPDFLYKFGSFWSDVGVGGTGLYVVNSTYSQIDAYTVGGVHQTSNWGGYGTALGKLNQPKGIAIGSSAPTYNVYVADTGNNRIQRFITSGVTRVADHQWGTKGSGNAQFEAPQGIAVDQDEKYLFVADTGNNRVQVIDLINETMLATIGNLGVGTTQFSSPKGILVTGSSSPYTVWVTDTGNNRVVKYSFVVSPAALTYMSSFGSYGVGAGQFNQPNKIARDSDGSIFVTDTTNRIQKFSSTGTFISSWGVRDSKGTTGLAITGTTLYAIEPYHQIDVYNSQSGSYSNSFTDESNEPVDVAIDKDDNIYIDNVTTNTIQKFNSVWVPMAEWGGHTTAFNVSSGIGVNSGGEVCVANTGANIIQRFDTNGNYLADLSAPPITPVAFSSPKDVAMEKTGNMYVVDSGNNRIIKYDSNNAFVWSIGGPTPTTDPAITPSPTPGPLTPMAGGPYFLNPNSIVVDTQNKIYVADTDYNRIQKFDGNGLFERSWGMYGSADSLDVPQFDSPQGVAIEEVDLTHYFLYVADTKHNRVQRFTELGIKDPNTDIWGEYGMGNAQFINPRKVALDSSKRIYVSENGLSSGQKNNRIQVFGNAVTNAGIVPITNGGVAVTEDGSVIDTYTLNLKSEPASNVTIAITSSDPEQLTVSSTSLTFTPYNWNIPQIVTVLPVPDYIDQANTQDLLLTNTSSSPGDPNYDGKISTISVTLTDTDAAGFTKTPVPSTAFDIQEGGTSTVQYKLNTIPSGAVTLNVVTDAQLTASPAQLTFTSTNWNQNQTVTYTAVRDDIANSDRTSVITHTLTSPPAEYVGVVPTDITATIKNTDTKGVTLTPTTVTVSETGTTTATYTVELDSKPTDTVNISIGDSSPTALVTVSPSTLTFLPSVWSTPQTVTVTAVHDYLQNGSQAGTVRQTFITHTSSSDDTSYDGANITIGNVTANVTDTDTSGLIIFKPGGGSVQVTEGGGTDEYAFQLTSKPADNIAVGISSTDGNVTLEKSAFTFTPTDWNVAQYATVSAVDNAVVDGTHYGVLRHTLTPEDTVADANFVSAVAFQTATITDNDTVGITVTQPNGTINIAEAGPTDRYFVRLSSQPTRQVTLIFSAQNQATSSPVLSPEIENAQNLVFNPNNWNVDQEVIITAIQDKIVEGPTMAIVSYVAVSADTDYNGKSTSFLANISDDDSLTPGISVIETDGGTSVTKDVKTDTYTLSLTSKPSANVKIKIVSNGPDATTSAGIFWFTPSTWNVPQTVNVTAKTNPSGSKTVTFSHLVTSLDLHYNNVAAPTVTITVNENKMSSPSGENVKAPTCGKTPPYNAPNLFQISTTQTQATLYFTPIRDNISYYFVAYGFTPGDMRFGTSFEWGPYDGVINYTVNMLTPGTTYYFTVRGGNGCATGPWSASVAATAVGSESSTQTTRTYYASSSSSSSGSSGSSSSGGSSGGSSPTGGIWLTRDLYPGSQGADVRSLQEYLNSKGFSLASSGVGSPGNETTYYGNLTAAAVRRFQEAHFAEILSPLGYASGTGICGSSTRNYINSHP